MVPPDLREARPKRLRFRFFALPAKVIVHARRLFARVAARLLELADAIAARRRGRSLSPAPA